METYSEMSRRFKTWLIAAVSVSAVAAVAGFIAGAIGNHWAGLCIFIPCAVICFGLLLLLYSGKRSGFFTAAVTAVLITFILIAGNPFGYTGNPAMTNLLVSLPFLLTAAVTAVFTVKEWKNLQ